MVNNPIQRHCFVYVRFTALTFTTRVWRSLFLRIFLTHVQEEVNVLAEGLFDAQAPYHPSLYLRFSYTTPLAAHVLARLSTRTSTFAKLDNDRNDAIK